MKLKPTLLLVLLCCSLQSIGQKEVHGKAAQSIHTKAEWVYFNKKLQPAAIRFDKATLPDFSELPQLMQHTYGNQANSEWQQVGVKTSKNGDIHYKYQLYINGVPVAHSTYLVHTRVGKILSMNGEKSPITLPTNTTPQISEAIALTKALNQVNATTYLWEVAWAEEELKKRTQNPDTSYYPTATLQWYLQQDNLILAWSFEILDHTLDHAQQVWVSATDGTILQAIPLTHHCNSGNGTTTWHGNESIKTDYSSTLQDYILWDDCGSADLRVRNWNSGGIPLEYTDANNSWYSSNDQSAVTSHWSLREAYDYFDNTFNHDSYDDNYSNINVYNEATFTSSSGNTYTNNASWNTSTGTMKIGAGNTTSPNDDWNTIDIIGHEFAHGVTGTSAGLIYAGESGALNESFSDIFGTLIERYAENGNNPDWEMGEDRGAIRDMSNPNQYNDPHTYLGTHWYTGSSNSSYVHTNSGVQNYWFYLLVDGGSGTNDNGDSYTVQSIGINDAADIAYEMLVYYMNASDDYFDARAAAINAAVALFGSGSQEEISVTDAWHAVGVGNPYGGNPPSTNCQCPFLNNQYPNTTLTPTSNWQTASNIWAGENNRYAVTQGATYEWSYCAADGGYTQVDLRLNLYDDSGNYITCTMDDCGLDPKLTWQATFTGHVRLQTNEYQSNANACMTNSTSGDLVYRQIGASNILNCNNAISLTCGQPYNGTTIGGNSDVDTYNCTSWNESGPEKVHTITTTSTGDITATLSNLGSQDLDVFILDACGALNCMDYGNNSATYTNAPAGTYYIVVDGYNGDAGSYTLDVSTGGSSQPFSINGNNTVCVNNAALFTISSPQSGTTYTWQATGSSTNTTGSSAWITFSQAGSQTVTVTASTSCGNPTSETYAVTVEGVPSINLTGPSTACTNTPITFTASGASSSGVNYNWQVTGGSYTTSANTATVTFTQGGTQSVSVTPYSTCGQGQIQQTSINVSALPTATIAGPTTACTNSPVTFTISNPTSSTTYNWQTSGGTVSGSGTSVSANFTQGGVQTITVTPSTSCGQGTPQSYTINVTDLSGFNINGFSTACTNTSMYYVLNNIQPGVNYQWQTTGGTLTSSGTSANITFSQSGTQTITVTPSSTCGTGTPQTFQVNVTTLQVSLASFPSFQSTDPAYTLIEGSPSGGTYSGNGVVGNIFYPTQAGVGSHAITYTYSQNGCTESTSGTITVSQAGAAPVADFTASQTNGPSNMVVNYLDLSANNPTSWLWTFDGGTPATSTQQHPTGITYPNTGVYKVSLTACNAIGCDTKTINGYITVPTTQIIEKSVIKVFPNPTTSVLNITISEDAYKLETLRLTNVLGQTLETSQVQLTNNELYSIDVSKYSSGQYILAGYGKEGLLFTEKIIIKH